MPSHKNSNTFVFKTFFEYINEIKIANLRRTEGYQSLPEDPCSSNFGCALMKWSELNITQHFAEFQRDIRSIFKSCSSQRVQLRNDVGDYVMSRDLVIIYEEKIADSLLHHLVIPQSMALAPLLELVVQFGLDVPKHFYELYFERFLNVLLEIIVREHHNPEALKDVFMCLTYLMKFLNRPMKENPDNIEKIFGLTFPLLSENKYPSYINNFAAEAMSYLMRKYKDLSLLFDQIFKKLNEDSDLVNGVGRLLMEMVRGVQKQLHSAAEEIIPELLNKLDRSDLSESVTDALCVLWNSLADYIDEKQSAVITRFLTNKLQKLKTDWDQLKEENGNQFSSILKLLNIWINHKQGVLVKDSDKLIELLELLIKSRERPLPDKGLAELMLVSSSILLAQRVNLAGYNRTKLLNAVFKSGYSYNQLAIFINAIKGLSLIEKDALPLLLDYLSTIDENNALLVVTQLLGIKLVDAPTSVSAAAANNFSLQNLRRYLLDFSRGRVKEGVPKFPDWLISSISDVTKLTLNSTCLAKAWAVIHCLPHIRPINKGAAVESIQRLINHIVKLVKELPSNNSEVVRLLSILKESIVTLAFFIENEDLLSHLPRGLYLDLVSQFPHNEDALMIVAFWLTCAKQTKQCEHLSKEIFERVFHHLKSNISSPYSQLRLVTLHILAQFDIQLPPNSNENIEQKGVFQICLDAELIPASFHKFRDKIVHLSKLSQEYVTNQIPIVLSEQIPLDYLIGQLHIHLELLFKPIYGLIKSYACGMDLDAFWEVFGRHLMQAAQATEMEVHGNANGHLSEEQEESSSVTEFDELVSYFEEFWKQNKTQQESDRPDFSSFRERLWTAMQSFPGSCETRSSNFVPVFFNFVEKEYHRHNYELTSSSTQDLRAPVDGGNNDEDEWMMDQTTEESTGNEEEQMETEEQVSEVVVPKEMKVPCGKQKNTVTSVKNVGTKGLDKILVLQLNVFKLFHNPRSLFQERQLYSLYLDLLNHQSPSVQKAAFDCLMTYKLKYLVPYRENFERLISEKTFRNEVVLFNINAEENIVNTDHRKDLIPVLMRILYGKLKMRIGKDSGGKTQSLARRNMILEFVANSSQEEVGIFLDLLLQHFAHFFADNLSDKVREVISSVDISRSIPLRKQQSVLTISEMIFKKLGNILGLYLPKMLKLVICLGGYCSALLLKRNEIAPKSVSLIKTIRNSVLARVNEFFKQFGKYPFSADEIEAMFEAVVWPQIEKLPVEGIHSPTALLRLCLTWSSDARYFCLLVKCSRLRPDVIPLPYVLQLLQEKNVSSSVTDVVMNIVENLLIEHEDTEEDEAEAEEKAPPIEPGSMWKIPLNNDVPYGTSMLLLYIPLLLPYLAKVVEGLAAAGPNGKRKTLPEREIKVLSRISSHVTDAEQCMQIAQQMLSILSQKKLKRNIDLEAEYLTTVRNMIDKIHQPLRLITILSKLFDSLREPSSRILLCSIITAISTKEPSLQETASVVCKINAWDARRLDEPDYEMRIAGFSEAVRIVTSDKLDVNFLIMMVHNCCYFLATVDDFSLRDKSTDCLEKIVLKLAAEKESSADIFQEIAIHHLLPLVKSKLKLKVEFARSVFIKLLRLMAMKFNDCLHFSSIRCLLKDNEEQDFFLNIAHIQVHRRCRALCDLASIVMEPEGKQMLTSALMSYVMPLVMVFLREETYNKYNELQDAAVRALRAIALRLSWDNYKKTLDLALKELSKGMQSTKLNVRILVAILDSFHFDLRNSQFNADTPYLAIKENEAKQQVKDLSKESLSIDSGETKMNVDEIDEDIERLSNGDGGQTMQVCSAGHATFIHRSIIMKMLPELHRCLTQKAKSDDEHKMSGAGKFVEDREILTIPIALAMIKLLKVLPQAALDKNISGILLKVIHFLQSRSYDIRKISYDTLQNIMLSLGPSYLKYVIRELELLLTRGYQLHVRCHAIWGILDKFQKQNVQNLAENRKPFIQSGDIDSCIGMLTKIFNEELFGEVAEEKEVDAISGRLVEARTTKSLESYGILALYISDQSLPLLISALKMELDTTRSHKVVSKISEVLRLVLHGLLDNKGLSLEALMVFVHAFTTESLGKFTAEAEALKDDVYKHNTRLQPPSCLLIQTEAPRGGKKPKANPKTNAHILVEFGLEILHGLLKRGFLVSTNKSHLQLLDPFIQILTNSLTSKHVKVTTSALKCLTRVFQHSLPSLKEHTRAIGNHLFVLLHNYAATGTGKGDNEEMVASCFKAITQLIEYRKDHDISVDQLHVLLSYVEQDLSDHTRHATAFPLLQAIITRKLKAKELPNLMIELEKLSIKEMPEIQSKFHKVILSYLLEYPMNNKQLEKHLDFYITQLSYEADSGKQSAINMLDSFFAKCPQKILSQWRMKFFLPLLQASVNPEAAGCQKQMLSLFTKFLAKLDNSMRDELIGLCVTLMKDNDPGVLLSGAVATTCFVEVETKESRKSFQRHLNTIFPLIQAQSKPGNVQSVVEVLSSYLDLLLSIFTNCDILRNLKWTSVLNEIWESVQGLLKHSSRDIRLKSGLLFSKLFESWKVEELLQLNNPNKSTKEYLQLDIRTKLYELSGAFCHQFSAPEISEEFAHMVISNIGFISIILLHLAKMETNEETNEAKASFIWILRRLTEEVKEEISNRKKETTIKRRSVFDWIGAITETVGCDIISPFLPKLLRPLIREITDVETDEILKTKIQEVLNIIRTVVGTETFGRVYAATLKKLTQDRQTRKNLHASLAVTDPEAFARKKIKKNLAKATQKRKKISQKRPGKAVKRPRLS